MRRLGLVALALMVIGSSAAAQPKPAPAKPAAPVPAKPGTPAVAPKPPAPVEKVEYAVTKTLKVGGEGMWEDAAIDAEGKLLYVPRATHTQVIELATGKVVADIVPQGSKVAAGAKGIVLVPEAGRGFITNNRDGTLTIFDLKTHAVLGTIAVGADAGSVVYDALSKRVFVSCTGAKQVVSVRADVDPKSGKPNQVIAFEEGTPKWLVADGNGMVYVTIGERDEISVIDTRVMKVATTWPMQQWHNPSGISMDRARSRLFVTCGNKLSIISATDGHELGGLVVRNTEAWKFASLPMAFHDGKIFSAAGDGTLAVVGQNAEGKFEVQQTLTVEQGARPVVVDPKSGKLYVPSIETDNKKPVADSFKILVVEKR